MLRTSRVFGTTSTRATQRHGRDPAGSVRLSLIGAEVRNNSCGMLEEEVRHAHLLTGVRIAFATQTIFQRRA